jgi:hypothetical protein
VKNLLIHICQLGKLGLQSLSKYVQINKKMKQTAVEWLLEYCDRENWSIPNNIIEQAKEMEKQQIEKAHGEDRSYLQNDGSWKTINGEQYYNETFNK